MGALAMREVEKRLTEDRRALVRGGLTPGRFLRKRTQHGKLLGKKCRKKVGKHARKSKQNRKCPQRGETQVLGKQVLGNQVMRIHVLSIQVLRRNFTFYVTPTNAMWKKQATHRSFLKK